MQPCYPLFAKVFKDKSIVIENNKLWIDNHFLVGFTPDGVIHKFYKFEVTDSLKFRITPYVEKKPVSINDCETWQQTIERNSERIEQLEKESLSLIKDKLEEYNEYDLYILNSTGKDSMVTMDLVHRINPNIPVMFNNTSLDCKETYLMAKQHKEWITTNPEQGFYQWIKEKKFIPTRFSRRCCLAYKEIATIKFLNDKPKVLFFMGVRNSESNARADREDISHNPEWGTRDWYGCLPIRKWTELDVWLYTLKHNLEINLKYKMGYGRVGCSIACPYATKYTWVLDKLWYRPMYKRWRNILKEDFIENERWTKLNCTLYEYTHTAWNGGLVREQPSQKVINEFMKYKELDDEMLARQYFNKTCCECGTNVRNSIDVSMNLKLINENTDKFYCKKCLIKKFELDENKYNSLIDEFKQRGCRLF